MSQERSFSVAQNVIWNTAGSLFYLVCQWLLSVLVVRLSGNFEDAGILSLAMSIATFFSVITLFNVRNYQASDSQSLYSSNEYVFHRFITCAASFILCTAFVLINSYDTVTSLSIIAYMLIKIVEGVADVLHGIAQKKWRLDVAGKSFIIRGILLIASFTVSMLLSGNLAVSIFAMAIATLIPLILYDFPAVRKIDSFKIELSFKASASLSKICLPMVIYGACINAIVPIARYALELFHGKAALGYYASVSTVAVLVQSLVTFIFTPLIGLFEEAYSKGDKKGVLKLLLKLAVLLLSVTGAAIVATALLGEFAMCLVFGEEIRDYVYLLYPTVVASALTALVWLFGMLLVVMRDSRTLLIGALLGFAVGAVLSFSMIPIKDYFGTNLSIIVSLLIICIAYSIRLAVYLFNKADERRNDGERTD